MARWPINHWPQRLTQTQALTPEADFSIKPSVINLSQLQTLAWVGVYLVAMVQKHSDLTFTSFCDLKLTLRLTKI